MYGKELALAQEMSDRSYENLLSNHAEASVLNDAFALETLRAKIRRFGWKGLLLFISESSRKQFLKQAIHGRFEEALWDGRLWSAPLLCNSVNFGKAAGP